MNIKQYENNTKYKNIDTCLVVSNLRVVICVIVAIIKKHCVFQCNLQYLDIISKPHKKAFFLLQTSKVGDVTSSHEILCQVFLRPGTCSCFSILSIEAAESRRVV